MRSLSVSSQHLKFQIFHNFLRGVGRPFLRDCLYTSPADLLIEFLKKGFNFGDLHDVFRFSAVVIQLIMNFIINPDNEQKQ